jgi:CysZ protein
VTIPKHTIDSGRKFFDGVALFWRGAAMLLRRPHLYLLGLIPAVIAFLILGVGLGVTLALLGRETAALTWFTADWAPWAQTTAQVVAGAALIGLVLLLSMWLFTALALAIGGPFFEQISNRIDDAAGVPPAATEPTLISGLIQGAKDSLRIGALAALGGIGLFLAEFVPVIGQTVVPLLAAVFGGWILVLELSGPPFARRTLDLRHRRMALRRHRQLALGLGTMTFVIFLIPLGAVLFMPVAVAAATLLAQRATELEAQPAQAKLTKSR